MVYCLLASFPFWLLLLVQWIFSIFGFAWVTRRRRWTRLLYLGPAMLIVILAVFLIGLSFLCCLMELTKYKIRTAVTGTK